MGYETREKAGKVKMPRPLDHISPYDTNLRLGAAGIRLILRWVEGWLRAPSPSTRLFQMRQLTDQELYVVSRVLTMLSDATRTERTRRERSRS